MSESQFFQRDARAAVRRAVESVESHTSAELVVAVRRESSRYRYVDIATGALVGFIVLLLLLFLPWPFAVAWMPAEVVIGFVIGALMSTWSWTWKRWLVRSKHAEEATWKAACTMFHEKGISRTSGRNGIFVMVSMMERRAQVVVDIGIDVDELGSAWTAAVDEIRKSVRNGPDFDAFVRALTALGPILGASMPRQEDDVNELPDEPDVA